VKRRPKPRRWALYTPTVVTLTTPPGCPDFAEPVTFTLPAGFDRYTPAQRRAWGRARVRQEVEGMARDMLAAMGMTAGPALDAAVAEMVRDAPIAAALEGDGL
jgi:hypothetical protein